MSGVESGVNPLSEMEINEKVTKRQLEEIRVTDRRHRYGTGEPVADDLAEPSPKRYPTVLDQLESRARAAEAKLAEALDLLRRREADADDFRARLRREMERRARGRVEEALRDFLEVVDSLDRGLSAAGSDPDPAHLRDGIRQVREQFLSALTRQGVEPIRTVGTRYDPRLAEAVSVASAEAGQEDDLVLEEIRRGYTLNGEVLRPAQVRVAKKPPSEKSESATSDSPGDS